MGSRGKKFHNARGVGENMMLKWKFAGVSAQVESTRNSRKTENLVLWAIFGGVAASGGEERIIQKKDMAGMRIHLVWGGTCHSQETSRAWAETHICSWSTP